MKCLYPPSHISSYVPSHVHVMVPFHLSSHASFHIPSHITCTCDGAHDRTVMVHLIKCIITYTCICDGVYDDACDSTVWYV